MLVSQPDLGEVPAGEGSTGRGTAPRGRPRRLDSWRMLGPRGSENPRAQAGNYCANSGLITRLPPSKTFWQERPPWAILRSTLVIEATTPPQPLLPPTKDSRMQLYKRTPFANLQAAPPSTPTLPWPVQGTGHLRTVAAHRLAVRDHLVSHLAGMSAHWSSGRPARSTPETNYRGFALPQFALRVPRRAMGLATPRCQPAKALASEAHKHVRACVPLRWGTRS